MKKFDKPDITPHECKSENLYDVVICDGKNFLIPDNCVECGKTLKKNETVSSSGKFKICSACRREKKSLLYKAANIFLISITVGFALFFTSAFLYRINFTLSVLISSVFSAISFTVLSLLLNVPNNVKITSPGKAVEIQRARNGKRTTVIFKNNVFAERFREINRQRIKQSDIFEHTHIRKKKTKSSSMIFYMQHFTIKMLSASLCCGLILTCCQPFLSKIQSEFNTYIGNTCIYPGCSLNRGENLYYCDNHKCSTESCERPICDESGYCHIHGE